MSKHLVQNKGLSFLALVDHYKLPEDCVCKIAQTIMEDWKKDNRFLFLSNAVRRLRLENEMYRDEKVKLRQAMYDLFGDEPPSKEDTLGAQIGRSYRSRMAHKRVQMQAHSLTTDDFRGYGQPLFAGVYRLPRRIYNY